MGNKIHSLFKQTFIYGLGNLLNQAAAFLLIPIYTAYLLPDEYGVLQLCRVYTSIMMIILLMGMSSSMFRVYYNTYKIDERIRIRNTALSFYILIAFSFFCFFFLFKILFPSIFYSLLEIENSVLVFQLIVLTVILEGFFSLELAVLRAEEKPLIYSIATFIRLIFYLTFCIYFIIYMRLKYVGILKAGIYSFTCGVLFLLPFTLKKYNFYISRFFLKEILVVGIPLAIGGLGIWVLNLSDRYMLKFLLPPDVSFHQIGIYSLGDKVSSIIKFLLVTPIMLSWGVLMFKFSKYENANHIFRTALNLFAVLLGSGFILISLFGEEIVRIISSNELYYNSYKVIPYLSLSKVLYGLTIVISAGIIISKKSKYIAISNLIAALINVLLNLILIPIFGYIGAAFASSFAFVINFFIIFYFSQKYHYFPYDLRRVLFFFIIIIIIILLANYFDVINVFKVLFLMIFLVSIYILKLIKAHQIMNIISSIKNKMYLK